MNKSENGADILLKHLTTLETELHKTETRRNRQRMKTLLHPEFMEFGRSGRRWTRADVLEELVGDDIALAAVQSAMLI
jgi:hypothetical protein